MPGYEVEESSEEGSTVWYAFKSRDADGTMLGGLNIYPDGSGKISSITGPGEGRAVIDAAGVTPSSSMADAYRRGPAFCGRQYSDMNGLAYWCVAESSPFVIYSIGFDACSPADRMASSIYSDEAETNLPLVALVEPAKCMIIDAIYLGNPLW